LNCPNLNVSDATINGHHDRTKSECALLVKAPGGIKMVNENELSVLKKYEARGWKVVRGGWPDFLMLKVEDGKITHFRFVEVKFKGDRLSYEQSVVKKVLSQLGEYVVERIAPNSKPDQPTPRHPMPRHARPRQTDSYTNTL